MIEESQSWIKENCYLDAKDRYGEWQCGIVLKVTKDQVKIRFDGWSNKYDETYSLTSQRLKPFRSIITGYTGQKKNPAVRGHWKFSEELLDKNIADFQAFTKNLSTQSEQQITQYLRGHHYFFTDFLMTISFIKPSELQKTYIYFKMHLQFVKQYLHDFIDTDLQSFLNVPEKRAYQASYFQIFDSVFLIVGGYLRVANFFKSNEQFLKHLIVPESSFQAYITAYFKEIQFVEKLEQVVTKLQTNKNMSLPLSFYRAIFHLYAAIDKLQLPKETKKKLLMRIYAVIENRFLKLDQNSAKNDEKDFDDLLSEMKQIFFKYTEKDSIFQWIENTKFNFWKLMLETDSLEKKLKGMSRIRDFCESLFRNAELEIIKTDKATLVKWIHEHKLLNIIFDSNEHTEIIKKGCEWVQELYQQYMLNIDNITFIWHICTQKHEAIKKTILDLWKDLTFYLKKEDIDKYCGVILDYPENFKEQWEIQFLFHITTSFANEHEEHPITYKLIELSYNKLDERADEQQLTRFAKILSYSEGDSPVMKSVIEKCFREIRSKHNIGLHLKLIAEIMNESCRKNIIVPENAIDILINQIPQVEPLIMELIFKLLDEILVSAIGDLELNHHHIEKLWAYFSDLDEEKHKNIFYNWLLKENKAGILLIRSNEINSIIQAELRQYIFKEILSNSRKLDYINMTIKELEIFIEFMIFSNALIGKLERKSYVSGKRIFKVKDPELEGIKEVWSIFLNCKNETVIMELAGFIKDIHINLSSKLPEEHKVTRMELLLAKIQRNIKDGFKKNNIKLMKHSLLLLMNLIYSLKEKTITNWREEYPTKTPAKIKVYKSESDIQELDIYIEESIMSIKEKIARLYQLPMENFILLNNKQEIPRECLDLPFFSFSFQEKIFKIIVIENDLQKYLVSFVQDKLYFNIVELLTNENICHDAYLVLLEVSFNEKVEQAFTRLLQASNQIQAQGTKMGSHHFYHQMYLLKILGMLIQENPVLIRQAISNAQLLKVITMFFSLPISTPLQIEMLLEIVVTLQRLYSQFRKPAQEEPIKAILNQEVEQITSNLMHCQLKLMKYLNHSMKEPIAKEVKLCINLLNLLEELHRDSTLKTIVSSEFYQEILVEIFQVHHYDYIKNVYFKKITDYIQNGIPLPLQKRICSLLHRIMSALPIGHNNMIFYRLFKNALLKANDFKELTTFGTQQLHDVCFKVIEQEWDGLNQENSLLQGHIEILEGIYTRNASLITAESVNYLVYNCLIFDQEKTVIPTGKTLETSNIKCRHPNTIKALLNLLLTVHRCYEHSKLLLSQVTPYHQLSYWRKSTYWSVSIEDEKKSSTGYVGMLNPGCICYLNSLMQQLYMIQPFRNKILGTPTKQKKEQELLDSMKLLFMRLTHSDEKFINPIFFTKSIKGYNDKPMIKIFEQMDIDEFCSILFDKIENQLEKDNNFIRELFGGIFSNEIISKECQHSSERQQPYLSISLDVKKTLSESFQALVKGQMLEGENSYYCERCDKKVRALKRLCLKRLPHHLIISLKRFEFNYEAEAKIKRNDYCEFPVELELTEFSQQHMSKDQQVFDEENKEEVLPPQYFKYRLKGVIVHTGSADSGHYYAFIEAKKDQWFQFNDERVQDFDFKNLKEEAFGGVEGEEFKVKNAYLLFYERVPVQTQKMGKKTVEEPHTMDIEEPSRHQVEEQNLALLKQIEETNKDIHKFHLFFSQDYQRFVESVSNNSKQLEQNQQYCDTYHKFRMTYNLLINVRIKGVSNASLCLKDIELLASNNPYIVDLLVRAFAIQTALEEFFVCCSTRDKAKLMANFLIQILKIKLRNDSAQSGDKKGAISEHVDNMLTSILQVIIKNIGNISELVMICRKLADPLHNPESSLQFKLLLYKKKVMKILLENSLGININKEKRSEKCTEIVTKIMEEKTGEDEQVKSFFREFVNDGRSSFRNNDKEAWHLLYILYSSWDEVYALEANENYLEGIQQCLALLCSKIGTMVQGSTDAKGLCALASFIQLILINQDFRDRIYTSLLKAIKDFDSSKYRLILLFCFKVIGFKHHVEENQSKMLLLFKHSLKVNEKYFNESDFLQQWLLKCLSSYPDFRRLVEENCDFIEDLIGWVATRKFPSPSTLRKYRNPNCEALNNRLHGIMVSSNEKDYEDLSRIKESKFNEIVTMYFTPLTYPAEYSINDDYHSGSLIEYFADGCWREAVATDNCYGRVSFENFKKEVVYLWEDSQLLKLALDKEPMDIEDSK